MAEGKKKPIMIGVIVGCLVLAGVITYMTRSEGPGGIEGIKRSDMIWVKCRECGAEYETSKRDYHEYLERRNLENPNLAETPALVCKECGKESVYRAVKCPKCGHVFFRGTSGEDRPDRCPECGYSQTEEDKEKAKEARRR